MCLEVFSKKILKIVPSVVHCRGKYVNCLLRIINDNNECKQLIIKISVKSK